MSTSVRVLSYSLVGNTKITRCRGAAQSPVRPQLQPFQGPRRPSHFLERKQLLTYLRLADKRLGLLINFNAALIKDGITRIVNGLEEESLAKPQGRQENQ